MVIGSDDWEKQGENMRLCRESTTFWVTLFSQNPSRKGRCKHWRAHLGIWRSRKPQDFHLRMFPRPHFVGSSKLGAHSLLKHPDTIWLWLTVRHGKSPFLIGKPSINGPFPMAMINNQRVLDFTSYLGENDMGFHGWTDSRWRAPPWRKLLEEMPKAPSCPGLGHGKLMGSNGI